MRCAICDKDDDNIVYDYTTKTFTNCSECNDVIAETLEDFQDKKDPEDDMFLVDGEFDDQFESSFMWELGEDD